MSDLSIELDAEERLIARGKSFARFLQAHSTARRPYPKGWFLDHWIGSSDLVAIFGEPGSGKSMLAIDLACRMAAGWDMNGNAVNFRRNVLYVAGERSDQVSRRLWAFCQHHGGEPFDNLAVYDGPFDLLEKGAFGALAYQAGETVGNLIDVVVIDTLAACMSASDSSPDAMGAAVRELNAVVSPADGESRTVIVVHHSPVSGEARMRGGGQLHGACDTVIHVKQSRGTSTAKVVKNNESSARLSLAFTMETVHMGEGDMATEAPVLIHSTEATKAAAAKLAAPLISKASRTAVDDLRAAIEAKGGPVTADEWRAASDTAAGDITPSGKRKRFTRAFRIVEDGLAIDEAGLFRLSEDRDKTGQNGDICPT